MVGLIRVLLIILSTLRVSSVRVLNVTVVQNLESIFSKILSQRRTADTILKLNDVLAVNASHVTETLVITDNLFNDADTIYQVVPILAWPLVLSYNLPNTDMPISLSSEMVMWIYNGTISKWNDSRIRELNPDVSLPGDQIEVLARQDCGAETAQFVRCIMSGKSYDGKFCNGFNWPVDAIKQKGNTNWGMAGLIKSVPNSIGYISGIFAKQAQLQVARMVRTKAIDIKTVDEVTPLVSKCIVAETKQMQESYFSFAYAVLDMWRTNCELAKHEYQFLKWLVDDEIGAKWIEGSFDGSIYPIKGLSNELSTKMSKRLDDMICGDDKTNVAKLLQATEKAKSTDTVTIVLVSVCSVLVVVVLGYFMFRLVRMMYDKKQLIKYSWKIAKERIELMSMTKLHHDKSKDSLSKVEKSPAANGENATANNDARWAETGIKMGNLDNRTVCMQKTRVRATDLKSATQRRIIHMISGVNNQNALPLYGITEHLGEMFIVTDYCMKGSLQNVLFAAKYNLDDYFKFSLAIDVARGMAYLHEKNIIHGSLKANCCYIDDRWVVRVGDWALRSILVAEQSDWIYETTNRQVLASKNFWTAPELLDSDNPALCNKKSDVYSYAILVQEIFTREFPYSEMSDFLAPSEIIESVKSEHLRPTVTSATPLKVQQILKTTWSQSPDDRPTFAEVVNMIIRANPSKKSVLDCMMDAVESYVSHLEDKVEERTAELGKAMKEAEALLNRMLPPSIAQKLQKGENIEPEYYESVTIFFSDIVGFTSLSAMSTPRQVITLLNELYTVFDSVIDKHEVYKVETIGDAYMVISGLPKRNGINHARYIANMALDIVQAAAGFKISHIPDRNLQIRVGVHSGPVMAGVVGLKMPRFCLFGDTVNTASRMESTSLPMKIQVTDRTVNILLCQFGGYKVECRGHVAVKGKGNMQTYWLVERDKSRPMKEDEIPRSKPPAEGEVTQQTSVESTS